MSTDLEAVLIGCAATLELVAAQLHDDGAGGPAPVILADVEARLRDLAERVATSSSW